LDVEAADMKKVEARMNLILKQLNSTAENQRINAHDYRELKDKSVDSMFIISFILSRFQTASVILHEAKRQWKAGHVYAQFLDYFNVTMECGDSCPIQFANAKACWLSTSKEKLYMDFTFPFVNSTLHLVEADPFVLHHKSANHTCKIAYTGPKSAI